VLGNAVAKTSAFWGGNAIEQAQGVIYIENAKK
jgi:hypothetical protein